MLPQYDNPILTLLRAYNGGDPAQSALSGMNRDQIRYLYDVGLGPIVAAVRIGELDTGSRQLLHAADLTARVVYDQVGSTTADVLEVANRLGTTVVLLKGVSIAGRYYPDPHRRVMGDIDLLVLYAGADELHQALLRSGFNRSFDETEIDFSKHHHLQPLLHPETGFSIEIHKRLFSHRFFRQESLFAESQLLAQTEPTVFRERECRRFQSEFELLYTVAHWAVDGKWAQNIVSINDVISLLLCRQHELDWIKIRRWLEDNEQTADCFAVLFRFLYTTALAQPIQPLEETVQSAIARVGRRNLRFLHSLLLRYPLHAGWQKGFFGSSEAADVWEALLESRSPGKRLLFATSRALWRRIGIRKQAESGFRE